MSWRERPSDSKSSAIVTRRTVRATTPVVLTAVPDRRRRPSDGFLVEASILARLLGIKLLKLEATVVVVPAEVTAPPSAPRELPARASARSSGGPPARRGAVGRGLAEAVRNINEGAELLAEAERNGA